MQKDMRKRAVEMAEKLSRGELGVIHGYMSKADKRGSRKI